MTQDVLNKTLLCLNSPSASQFHSPILKMIASINYDVFNSSDNTRLVQKIASTIIKNCDESVFKELLASFRLIFPLHNNGSIIQRIFTRVLNTIRQTPYAPNTVIRVVCFLCDLASLNPPFFLSFNDLCSPEDMKVLLSTENISFIEHLIINKAPLLHSPMLLQFLVETSIKSLSFKEHLNSLRLLCLIFQVSPSLGPCLAFSSPGNLMTQILVTLGDIYRPNDQNSPMLFCLTIHAVATFTRLIAESPPLARVYFQECHSAQYLHYLDKVCRIYLVNRNTLTKAYAICFPRC